MCWEEGEREKYIYLIWEDLVLIKFYVKILYCEFCDFINVMSIFIVWEIIL